MTSPKKPGIVDPWRVVDPIEAPKRPPPTGLDLDADLRVPGRYVIRSEHCSFDVTSHKITEPADAVDVLVECLAELLKLRIMAAAFAAAGIGLRVGTWAWNAPEGVRAASLHNEKSTVWFTGKPFAEGMLVLARLLREPACAHVMRHYGIVVMIAA